MQPEWKKRFLGFLGDHIQRSSCAQGTGQARQGQWGLGGWDLIKTSSVLPFQSLEPHRRLEK